ncbi:MAG: hypothetical protein AB1566_07870 [Chloroflexota bacterium]
MPATFFTSKEVLTEIGDKEVVLVPLAKYNALLAKLQDLQDVLDMLEAQKEPGRPLEDYLRERGLA